MTSPVQSTDSSLPPPGNQAQFEITSPVQSTDLQELTSRQFKQQEDSLKTSVQPERGDWLWERETREYRLREENLEEGWRILEEILEEEYEYLRNVRRLRDEESKKHFEDAMEHGYVECTMTTCAVTGAAGSGKSHTMSLVFNEDPPAVRESTGLCEPVRAISTVVGTSESDSSEWTRVDEDKVLSIVAGATTVTNTKEQSAVLVASPEEVSESSGSSDAEGSSDASDNFEPDTEGSSNDSCKSELESQASHAGVVDELLEKLANGLKESGGQKRVTKLDFLYFLDSGGQPQFHELLPSFIPNLSAILFVLKLSEKLSHNPEVEFYEKGRLVCSYRSLYSHEQILKRCIRALQPENRSIESSSSSSPCIAIVGTHRDLELSCEGETREEKNQKLLDLLQPTFGNNLIFFGNVKELIFPINARQPSQEDRGVAGNLREAIIPLSTPKPVPLPWFILEHVLKLLAKERGTGVMHIDRCREVAERLHIKHDAFDAALQYLVGLNVFLYYPTVLPNVLFCEPQVALDKINELVQYYHILCGGSNTLPGNAASSCTSAFSGKKWMHFQRFGVFQERLLHDKAFSGHYDEDLFTPSDLLKLLEALHIVGKVNTTDVVPEYVMPSLLFELKPDELDEHRCNPTTSPAAPLLVHFPDEWPTSGLFCSFLTSLLSTCRWEVMIDSRNQPTCLYKNCLEFEYPEMLGKITLIDSFDQGYFEVHVDAPLEECKQFCPKIRQALFTALSRKAPQAKQAFFCPKSGTTACSSSLHVAHILPRRNYWRCSEKRGEVYGSLADNMSVWGIGTQTTGSSTVAEESKVVYQNPAAGAPTEQDVDGHLSQRPTLPKLLKFPCKRRSVNIASEIGAKYTTFGILLLDDQTGARITTIARKHANDGEQINLEILLEWLQGRGTKPVTWETLVEILKDMELSELAKDIEANLFRI